MKMSRTKLTVHSNVTEYFPLLRSKAKNVNFCSRYIGYSLIRLCYVDIIGFCVFI